MRKHFIFMIHYIYAFCTVHEVLTASILGWFAVPSLGKIEGRRRGHPRMR